MVDQELDRRRTSAAQNQSFFRDVNERIEELSQRLASSADYICECFDVRCVERVPISAADYAHLRREANCFFVLRGHDDGSIDEILYETEDYLVVRKLGVGAQVAEQYDGRATEHLRLVAAN